jgi:hypothetical protein
MDNFKEFMKYIVARGREEVLNDMYWEWELWKSDYKKESEV